METNEPIVEDLQRELIRLILWSDIEEAPWDVLDIDVSNVDDGDIEVRTRMNIAATVAKALEKK